MLWLWVNINQLCQPIMVVNHSHVMLVQCLGAASTVGWPISGWLRALESRPWRTARTWILTTWPVRRFHLAAPRIGLTASNNSVMVKPVLVSTC